MGSQPEVLQRLPGSLPYKFPAVLSARAALSRGVVRSLRPLLDKSLRSEAISEWLLELHARAFELFEHAFHPSHLFTLLLLAFPILAIDPIGQGFSESSGHTETNKQFVFGPGDFESTLFDKRFEIRKLELAPLFPLSGRNLKRSRRSSFVPNWDKPRSSKIFLSSFSACAAGPLCPARGAQHLLAEQQQQQQQQPVWPASRATWSLT